MAKAKQFKFAFSGTESGDSLNHAKPGMYKAKIKEINEKDSKSSGNPMLEIVLEILPSKKKYAKVWYYIVTGGDNPQEGRLREFFEATGVVKKGAKSPKGAVDLGKLIGMEIQVQLKSDTDQDDEYRPRVGKVLSPASDEDIEEDDDTDEDEEDEEDDDEEDDDEEDDDEEDDDEEDDDSVYTEEELEEMSSKALKDVAEEQDVEVPDGKLSAKRKKALIAAILEAQEDDDDDDEDDEDDDDKVPPYEEWDIADLKAELKERGLPTKGKKSVLIARLEKDDESDEDPFDGNDD